MSEAQSDVSSKVSVNHKPHRKIRSSKSTLNSKDENPVLDSLQEKCTIASIALDVQSIIKENNIFCTLKLGSTLSGGQDSYNLSGKLDGGNYNQKKNFNYYGRYRFKSASKNQFSEEDISPQKEKDSIVFEGIECKPNNSEPCELYFNELSTIRSLYREMSPRRKESGQGNVTSKVNTQQVKNEIGFNIKSNCNPPNNNMQNLNTTQTAEPKHNFLSRGQINAFKTHSSLQNDQRINTQSSTKTLDKAGFSTMLGLKRSDRQQMYSFGDDEKEIDKSNKQLFSTIKAKEDRRKNTRLNIHYIPRQVYDLEEMRRERAGSQYSSQSRQQFKSLIFPPTFNNQSFKKYQFVQ